MSEDTFRDKIIDDYYDSIPDTYEEAVQKINGDVFAPIQDPTEDYHTYGNVTLTMNIEELATQLVRYPMSPIDRIKFIKQLFCKSNPGDQDQMLNDLAIYFVYKTFHSQQTDSNYVISRMIGKFLRLKGLSRPMDVERVDTLTTEIQERLDELVTYAGAESIVKTLESEIEKCLSEVDR